MSQKLHYDLCVVGGGLIGVSVARDAAGRGLSVLLVEAGDLGGAASSSTSKFIDGGVLEVENGSFPSSVKHLKEREKLSKSVPHMFLPLPCIMPLDQNNDKGRIERKVWKMKLCLHNLLRVSGAFSKSVFETLNGDDKRLLSLINPELGEEEDNTTIMKPHERLRFLGNITSQDYARRLARDVLSFDLCRIDDTRLVACLAVDASMRGARILTYTRCKSMKPFEDGWQMILRARDSRQSFEVNASMVVNATGAGVADFVAKMGVSNNDPDLPVVGFTKSSHIILPRQYEGNHAYVLRQADGEIVYTTPYEGDYTLLGTSKEEESAYDVDPEISGGMLRYLIESYNAAFEKSLKENDVVFSFSALRPVLLDSVTGEASHNDYLVYYHKRCDSPLLSVYGGNMGVSRLCAESVVDKLMTLSGRMIAGWTGGKKLVNFVFPSGFESYLREKKKEYPWLPDFLLERYVRSYGTRIAVLIGDARSMVDLGVHYGDGFYEAELNYLKAYEWVFNAQDVLWRRSKLALHVGAETGQHIENAFSPDHNFEQEEYTRSDGNVALCA